MTTSNRFNPEPDQPYGKCTDCNLELPTEEDAAAHRKATAGSIRTPGRSYKATHATRATNPGRQERLRQEVRREVESAIEDLMAELARLVEDQDATKDEIATALSDCYVDLAHDWKHQEVYEYEEEEGEDGNNDNA